MITEDSLKQRVAHLQEEIVRINKRIEVYHHGHCHGDVSVMGRLTGGASILTSGVERKLGSLSPEELGMAAEALDSAEENLRQAEKILDKKNKRH